ncbi:hypothetical protein Pcinc_012222 [Petrolisthes cinctipes]|uniref:Uncharacterized protein n=1 Tax=Petrolisthes cinctipes TaxID=88211 RepID=A0AAE1KRP3_PETCI|nr:hypothetical protein Pcinc_012222 [Petrolisthes cinctipes]
MRRNYHKRFIPPLSPPTHRHRRVALMSPPTSSILKAHCYVFHHGAVGEGVSGGWWVMVGVAIKVTGVGGKREGIKVTVIVRVMARGGEGDRRSEGRSESRTEGEGES